MLLDISISRKAKPVEKPAARVDWETVHKFPDGSSEQIGPRGRRRRVILIRCVECELEQPETEFAYRLPNDIRMAWEAGICRGCMLAIARRNGARSREDARKAITARFASILERAADCSSAERRAAIVRFASPSWRDRKAISDIYAEARALSRETGQPHDVDHFYPLQSPICCGLHIAGNLRVVKASSNRSKGNTFPLEHSPCYAGMSVEEINEAVFELQMGG